MIINSTNPNKTKVNKNKIIIKMLSPFKILLFVWSFSLFMTTYTSNETLESFTIWNSVYTSEGLLWLFLSIFSFGLGTFSIDVIYKKKNYFTKKLKIIDIYFSKYMLLIPFYISLITFIYMLLSTIYELGGIFSFTSKLINSWHFVSDVFAQNKPFPGARLLYTGFVGIGIYASSVYLTGYKKKYIRIIVIFSFMILFIIPILISQRILFMTLLISVIVASLFIKENKLKIVKLIFLAMIVSLTVWSLLEIIRVYNYNFFNNPLERIMYSLSRLSLYFANDLANLNNAIKYIDGHTFGLRQLGPILEYLFIEDLVYNINLIPYKIHGTWTGLGIQYIDFGWFGLFETFIIGVVAQIIYIKAKIGKFFYIQLYGFVVSGIVLSFHFAIWHAPYFYHNLIVLILLNSFTKVKYDIL